MKYRYAGNSGLKISEITYGNWLTHGSQVENEVATKCVHAALDAGITSFDTADVYANTVAESVLGEALKGQRRESLEIFTKVYWPTGPGGANDTGLSRKHIMESINGSLERLQTDYVDIYQAHRMKRRSSSVPWSHSRTSAHGFTATGTLPSRSGPAWRTSPYPTLAWMAGRSPMRSAPETSRRTSGASA